MQSAASHLSRSACRKCHIEETAPLLHLLLINSAELKVFIFFYFFIFVYKKLIPAAYSHCHRSICSFLPFNKIEHKLMMCCLLVHDELVNGPFIFLFFWLLILRFFVFFQGSAQRLGVLSSADSTALSSTSD